MKIVILYFKYFMSVKHNDDHLRTSSDSIATRAVVEPTNKMAGHELWVPPISPDLMKDKRRSLMVMTDDEGFRRGGQD